MFAKSLERADFELFRLHHLKHRQRGDTFFDIVRCLEKYLTQLGALEPARDAAVSG